MYDSLITEFVAALNAKFAGEQEFSAEQGRKFTKVVQKDAKYPGSGGSVHCFVERATGLVIKAATWKAPQKDVSGLAYRADLVSDFAGTVSRADKFGSYLYKPSADKNARSVRGGGTPSIFG